MSLSARSLLLRIWFQLRVRRRVQLAFLFLIMLVGGGLEIISLGAVLPFLTLLSNPNLLWQQSIIRKFATSVGLTQPQQLIIPLTIAFVLSIVLSAFFRISTLWINGRLSAAIGSDLSSEAYKRTLYQPYEVHLLRNSSSVINSVTTQIGSTVVAIRTILQVSNSTVTAISLLIGLFFIDAQVAFACVLLFGTIYLFLAFTVRRKLRSNGRQFATASKTLLKAVQEGLGSIRDLILDGNQPVFLAIYKEADLVQRQLKAQSVFLGSFPRYLTEAVGMLSIGLLGVYLMFQRGSSGSVIPILGTFAVGAQRLLPAFQQIYSGWAILKTSSPNIAEVLLMLQQPLPASLQTVDTLDFRESFVFEDISYRYGQSQPFVLSHLNFQIRSGECIGFIGPTGSGKSTVIDLLMGLLVPTHGRLVVDGIDLYSSHHPDILRAWRATIAHVPQVIYLADTTIAENIAFGVPKHKIDMDRVRGAAYQAQLSDFIASSDLGYETFVGERGVRLSGGQRQRIGIARALYKNAKVLVFDEATSALDNDTETALMKSVNLLRPDVTIIMVAHRLSTLQGCDRLFLVENGSISLED